MALNFTNHPDVVFRKAPLVTVLSQIHFEPVLSLLSEVGIAGFQEGIRHLYPHLSGEQAGQLEVAGQPNGAQRVGFRQSAPVWRMIDEEGNWRVSLAIDFVALETPRYTDFGEFLDRLMFVLDVLDRTVNVGDSTRIGLRKINLLTHPSVSQPSDWAALLRSDLLPLVGHSVPGMVAQSLSETRLQEGFSQLMIRHGLIQKEGAKLLTESVGQFGSPAVPEIASSQQSASPPVAQVPQEPAIDFVLDLDYFTIAPYPARRGEDIAEVLREFSDGITSFFHWAIKKPYFDWLEPRPRNEAK